MAGAERMKRLLAILLILLALSLPLASCVNYVPRGDESGSTAESTEATGTDETLPETESGTSAPTDDGDIPNEPEDGYTKFY